jgi:ribosomal protein S18 acetylase RimI-like enzyme
MIKRITAFHPELVLELFSKIEATHIEPNRLFFDDEKNILLVSYLEHEPGGFLYAYTLEDIKSNQSKIFLYSIDVFHPFRRQGIASSLIEALKMIAREKGCREIFVMTNKANLAAMRLYEKTGGSVENNDDVLFVYAL